MRIHHGLVQGEDPSEATLAAAYVEGGFTKALFVSKKTPGGFLKTPSGCIGTEAAIG
jgi:hypothetical protein